MAKATEQAAPFIEANHTPWFTRGFGQYTLRLIRKRFFAVRLAHEHRGTLADLESHGGPALIVLNHSSWWDPLIALALHRLHTPTRTPAAPMDHDQLKRFGFFKRVGIFGVDPHNAASLERMGAYMRQRFGEQPRTTLWITAQGEFADVRAPIRIRPGSAAIAARTPGVRVLSVAIEYGFWVEQKPEVFLRFQPIPATGASPSTTDWHRALSAAMGENSAALASLVQARDPEGFAIIHGKGSPQTTPLYDLYLRLTGRAGSIQARKRGEGVGA